MEKSVLLSLIYVPSAGEAWRLPLIACKTPWLIDVLGDIGSIALASASPASAKTGAWKNLSD